MTTYDPALIERLATWARGIVRSVTPHPEDEIAVTMHANLSAMADQLEAAKFEVARLYTLAIEQGERAVLAEAERDAMRDQVHVLTAATRADQLRVELACEERDKLEKERDALRAEVEEAQERVRQRLRRPEA